jgi:hypothetical protein
MICSTSLDELSHYSISGTVQVVSDLTGFRILCRNRLASYKFYRTEDYGKYVQWGLRDEFDRDKWIRNLIIGVMIMRYSPVFKQWAGPVLPLGKSVFEIDFHVNKMREIQKKYDSQVQVTWHHNEDLVTLALLDPVLTV